MNICILKNPEILNYRIFNLNRVNKSLKSKELKNFVQCFTNLHVLMKLPKLLGQN